MGILAVAAAAALLYYGRVFFITVIIATIIAFLLEPMVEFFHEAAPAAGAGQFPGGAAMALIGLYMAGLGLYSQSQAFIDSLPVYGVRLNELVDSAATRMDRFQTSVYRTVVPRRFQEGGETMPPPDPTAARLKKKKSDPAEAPPIQEVRVRPEQKSFVNYLYDYVRSFYDVLLMASFVPFLVYFILSWRDQMRSRLLATMEGEARATVAKTLDGVAEIVRAYVIRQLPAGTAAERGQRAPFRVGKAALLAAGGAVERISESDSLYRVAAGHAPAAGRRAPRSARAGVVLGHRHRCGRAAPACHQSSLPEIRGLAGTPPNPLVVTIALMLWGMLWGGIGLLLAIPLTAALKAVCDNVGSLKPFGRLLGD